MGQKIIIISPASRSVSTIAQSIMSVSIDASQPLYEANAGGVGCSKSHSFSCVSLIAAWLISALGDLR